MVRTLVVTSFLVSVLLAPSARSATVPAISLEGLVRSADTILRGTVIAEHPLWHRFGDGPPRLYTVTEVRVTRMLSGAHEDETALVLQLGGADAGIASSVPGTARLLPGDEVLLFTRTDGVFHYLVGMGQGAFVLFTPSSASPSWQRVGLPNLVGPAPGAPSAPVAADVWLEGALEAAIGEALVSRGGAR